MSWAPRLGLDCDWAAAGRINRIRAHAPIARALRSDLHLGDRAHGAGRKRAVRVSRCGHRSERGTNSGSVPYKILEFTVTIVVNRNNSSCARAWKRPPRGGRCRRAAGQGLEPQLPEPESGVLPLDDPAGLGRDGSNVTAVSSTAPEPLARAVSLPEQAQPECDEDGAGQRIEQASRQRSAENARGT